MGQVIQTPRIERHIVTKQGEVEVTINLNLTITLDNAGGLKVSATTDEKPKSIIGKTKFDEDKVDKLIPEFVSSDELLDFGKVE